ncbi:response regulator transcription factor [Sphaerothrix gracilis]|uniref:response regulator transcription factor n=1 Tax=Sphaerothrix gracilis TaxID=3151835 RepID=UPI0031FBEAA9
MTPDLAKLKVLVVEDHPVVLEGTLSILKQFYSDLETRAVDTEEKALKEIFQYRPDLIILDLQIPEKENDLTKLDTGVDLLKKIMKRYPEQNLAVQSSFVSALCRIKPDIDNHQGGFTVIDKGRCSTQEIFERFDCALKGYTHTKDIRGLQAGLEVKPEWLKILAFACEDGLQDRSIAQQINVSEGTIRHYWTKIYDVLGIYPEDVKGDGKNLRVLSCNLARSNGLID